MRTLRNYIAREVAMATLLVFVALLLLFAFFDLVEQIRISGVAVTSCVTSCSMCCCLHRIMSMNFFRSRH